MPLPTTGEVRSAPRSARLAQSIARGWCVIRELAHGIRLAWIASTSIAVGIALFLVAPQTQDLFLEVRGNVYAGTAYWLAFYGAVLLGWMFPVYLSTRWMLWHFREGATDWTREEPVRDWVRRSLPTLLASGCLVAVLAGQIMALVNAPTILDENMERALERTYRPLWDAAQQCGNGYAPAVLYCKFVKLGNYAAGFYSVVLTERWGSDQLILYTYAVLASVIIWLAVRTADSFCAHFPGTLRARLARIALWMVGATTLSLVGGATMTVLSETGELLSFMKLISTRLESVFVIVAASWFIFALVLKFRTTRGLRITNPFNKGLLGTLFYLPMLIVLLPFYGFARNELSQPISIGHMAALPAVTALLIWLTWQALGPQAHGRASRLGERLLAFMRPAATAGEEAASAALVAPLFYTMLAVTIVAAVLLSIPHPVDITTLVPRALLLPFVLGFFIIAFTYLSYWSARTRAPLVIGLIASMALLSSFLHDPHDVRTTATTASRPDLSRSIEQWAAANDCRIEPAGQPKAAGKAVDCPSPILISAAGGASRAGFLVGGVIGKLIDEPTVLTRQGHSEKINQLVMSLDGKLIATSGEGGTGRRDEHTVRISEVQTGRQTAVLRIPSGSITAAGFDRTTTFVIAHTADRPKRKFEVRIWDAKSGKHLTTFSDHTDEIVSTSWWNDNRRFLSVSNDKTARLWHLDGRQNPKVINLKSHTGKITDANLYTERSILLTASDDKTVRLWNVETGEELPHYILHPDQVISVSVSDVARRIMTISADGIARLWTFDPANTAPIELKVDGARIDVGQFNSDNDRTNDRILTRSSDGRMQVWSAQDGRRLTTIQADGLQVLGGDLSGDGRRVVYLTSDNVIRTWDVEASRQIAQTQAPVSDISFINTSKDGKWIVTTSGAAATTWSAETMTRVAVFNRSWAEGRKLRPFEKQLFSISAVSGGALGAVVSYAALADAQDEQRAINGRLRPPCHESTHKSDDDWYAPFLNIDAPTGSLRPWQPNQSWQSCLEALMAGDFLSPVFYSLNRDDLLSADNGIRDLLGIERRGDRAAVLEQSWEMRYARLTRQPSPTDKTAKQLPTLAQSLLEVRQRTLGDGKNGNWLPMLFLNGTSVSSGRRIIASDINAPFGVFQDSDDLHTMLGSQRDIRLSTGATMSARFPIISPHGSIRDDVRRIVDRVVDGGYFENYGAITTLELVRELKRYGLDPLVILVNNEPSNADVICRDSEGLGGSGPPPLSENAAFSLVLSPLKAVAGTRSARGSHAAVQLCNELGSKRFAYITVARDPRNPHKALSMSWWLSKHVQKYLSDQLDQDGVNRDAFAKIEQVR